METKPIRVLLADDHTLVRAGFRRLLQSLGDVEVVAEAEEGRGALRLIEEYRPDVVLMDIAMPGLNGLETTVQIAERFPQVHVIILSMHINEEYVTQALRAGAEGYLLKDSGPEELELAFRAAMRGEIYLSPPISKQVISDYIQRTSGEPGPFAPLTPRQREVLQLIAEGLTTRQIAHTLDLSVKTIQTHRAHLMERLDIHDIASLVRYAVRVGLVSPER